MWSAHTSSRLSVMLDASCVVSNRANGNVLLGVLVREAEKDGW